MIFQYSVLAIWQLKVQALDIICLSIINLLKKWVKIVGNDHLVKYTMLIGYLVEKNLLVITEKFSLIFTETYRAISI